MLWPLVWICHPTPPLHSEKVMPCSLQDNYRKACEDAKENTDMPPTVLAIVSHCSGPTCPLTSVHLSPSLPSGACEQQRMLLDEPARLSMWSWADPAFGWELAKCCRRCSGPFGRGGMRWWQRSRLQGVVKLCSVHSTLNGSSNLSNIKKPSKSIMKTWNYPFLSGNQLNRKKKNYVTLSLLQKVRLEENL